MGCGDTKDTEVNASDGPDAGEIVYFALLRSRGEVVRMVAAHGGVKYKDTRLSPDEWNKFKEEQGKLDPKGIQSLPYIKKPDGKNYAETCDLMKYLAELGGKFTVDDATYALAKECNEGGGMMADPVLNMPEAMWKDLGVPEGSKDEALKLVGAHLKTLAEKLGDKNFFGGDKPGYGEVFAFHNIDNACTLDEAGVTAIVGAGMEKLKAFHARFAALEGIKEYLAGRSPVAGFPGTLGNPVGPITLTITNTWNEGKTKEEVAAVLKAAQGIAIGVPGVTMFQYAMNEEKKENTLTEIYESPDAVGAFFEAAAPALPDLFGAITTTEVIINGPQCSVDGLAENDALKKFNPTKYYFDAIGVQHKPAAAENMVEAPITLTITNKWNDGKTKAEVAGVLKAAGAAALAADDGVYAFQYAMNDAKKENTLTEIYKDGAAVGAFLKAAEPLLPTLFGVIETTKVVASGPKAAMEAAAPALEKFNPVCYFTDDVGPACKH